MDAYRQETGDNTWVGVVFTGDFTNGWPSVITYKLRVALPGGFSQWDTDYTYPFYSSFGYRNNNTDGGSPGNVALFIFSLSLKGFSSKHCKFIDILKSRVIVLVH